MQIEDMVLISVDDHVVEPPSMASFFRDHVPGEVPGPGAEGDPARRRHRRLADRGQGDLDLRAQRRAGPPREDWGSDPANFDQVRPGTYDIHERIRDMNVNGVLASICFPSWPGIARPVLRGQRRQGLRRSDDPGLQRLAHRRVVRGVSRAVSSRWRCPDSRWAADWMAEEIRRVAEKGCHAVSLHPETYRVGFPDYHGDEWDAAWAACEEVGTVMVFHFGGTPNFMPRSPFDVIPHVMPFQTAIFAAELLWSPIMRKFPKVPHGPGRGRHRLDPVLPREGRLRLRPPSPLDRRRLRGQAPVPGVPRARPGVLHRRRDRAAQPGPDRDRHDHLGVRLPALGFAPGPRPPRC